MKLRKGAPGRGDGGMSLTLLKGDSGNRWSWKKYIMRLFLLNWIIVSDGSWLTGWTLLKPDYERTASPGPWRSLPSCLRRWPKPTPWSYRKRSWKPPTLWWLRKVQVERPPRMHHLVKRRRPRRRPRLQSDGCEFPTKIDGCVSPMTRNGVHWKVGSRKRFCEAVEPWETATGSSLTNRLWCFWSRQSFGLNIDSWEYNGLLEEQKKGTAVSGCCLSLSSYDWSIDLHGSPRIHHGLLSDARFCSKFLNHHGIWPVHVLFSVAWQKILPSGSAEKTRRIDFLWKGFTKACHAMGK